MTERTPPQNRKYTFSRYNPVRLASNKAEYRVKKRGGSRQKGCTACKMHDKCVRRLKANMWVCCEIPTIEELAYWGVSEEEYRGS